MYYQEHERQLFPYFNGEREVVGDPLRIWRFLNNLLDGDPDTVLAKAHSQVPEEKLDAQNRIIEATREAFMMEPFDSETGEGATEQDCLVALTNFLDWIKKKGPNTGNSLSGSAPTMSPPVHLITRPTSV